MSTNSPDRADHRDGAAVRFPPPLVYVGALALGALLQTLVPLDVGLALGIRAVLAAVIAASAVALMVGAVALFNRTGQDPKPWLSTPEIISTGVYRFTRNPMYVSMALLQGSIGLVLANPWTLALVPVSLGVVHVIAVRPEEAYLQEKFGAAYADYRASVRRWL